MRIWKYTLAATDIQTVQMPVGVKMLDVQVQGEDVCLWVLVDQNNPLEERKIAIYGTGNPMPQEPGKYIATFQLYEGRLVFHAFDATVML